VNIARPDAGESWAAKLVRWRGEKALERLRQHQHSLRALRPQSQTPRLSRQRKAPRGLSFDALRSYGVITADQFDGLLYRPVPTALAPIR